MGNKKNVKCSFIIMYTLYKASVQAIYCSV